MKLIPVLLAVLWLVALQHRAPAQCCTAGSPVSTNCALTDNGAHLLNVTWSYLASFSDTYYRGTERLDKRYTESNFDYASLALSYGVSGTLRVTADVGYYFDKAQRFVNSDYTRHAQGISDGTIGINYSAYSSDDRLFDIMQTAKVTIPFGAFNQEYDGVVLPIDFQPSAGNVKYSLGVILSKRFAGSPFALMSFNAVEFSEAIETAATYHKYGNLYNVSLLGAYRISPLLQGFLQLRCEMRERALNGTIDQLPPSQSKNNQYSYINASGGVIAYLSPQIAVNVLRDWTVSFQYNYPFYKNVYGGEQLTNRHSISANISRVIDFGGQPMQPGPGMKLSTLELPVHGNCDMCKTRIEEAATAVEGVASAEWSPDTKILAVRYADAVPDRNALEKALAAAGHDTEAFKAPDAVYDKLPACCLYRK